MRRLLITAEKDEAADLLEGLSGSGPEPLHLPLEKYEYGADPEQSCAAIEASDTFRFVIHGGLRNARYFLAWMERCEGAKLFREKIHLVMNTREARLLEEEGIPAILPVDGARPIDLMEFLLRISTGGGVLYPAPEESFEEMPGLLEELGIDVTELTVCRTVSMAPERLEEFRKRLQKREPDAILFHSRGSVVRTETAFPAIDLHSCQRIAASAGVAWTLRQKGLTPSHTASGSWSSLLKLLLHGESERS